MYKNRLSLKPREPLNNLSDFLPFLVLDEV